MKGKKLIIYTSISVLIILVSFVMYFGFSDAEKTNIQNIGFTFTIITEVVFFGTIYLITRNSENTFSRAGIASISVIYLIISLILNIFAKTAFETERALITTNIIILILYLAIALITQLFKKEK